MCPPTNPCNYVSSSTTRQETLSILASENVERRHVVERVDASESAVYNAFAGLAERGVIFRDRDGWAVTGMGRAIADALDRCQRVDRTIHEDAQFWRTHDVDRLPRSLRDDLFATTSITVFRSSRADPGGAYRRLAGRLSEARSVDAALAAYHSSLVEAFPSGVSRVLITDETDGCPTVATVDEVPAAQVRTGPVGFTMILADDVVALVLPTLDGRIDPYAALVVDDDSVSERCRQLFDASWNGDAREVASGPPSKH